MKDKQDIKIFVDAHVVDGPYQGSRTFIEHLYREIVNMEGIKIFMAAYNTEQLRKAFNNDERIHYVPYRSRNRLRRILLEIPAITKQHEIDYAHFQYISPVKIPCKTIVTTHDVIFRDIPSEFSLPYRIIKNFLYYRSASKADIVTTVSIHSKQSIQKHFNINKPVHVIPNGIHPEFFSRISKTKAIEYVYEKYGIEKFLLCVSRIEPRKNHAMMVRTFSKLGLAGKGYFLVFLGNKTTEVPELLKELKKLSSRERQQVLIMQDVEEEELKFFLRAAMVFIYPSRGEGFGIPPLEAAAMRTPVICSNTTAMRDFDFFGEHHIDPDNEELFEKKLSEILNDPPPHELLAKRSMHIRDHYSWKKSAEKFYEVVKDHHQKQLQ